MSQAATRAATKTGGKGEVPSEKGVFAPPEVVFKMSKKIAQLTKVIYYLNTKNEDHNVEIQSLIDAYEDELTEAIKDGTNKITELKLGLEMTEAKVIEAEKQIQQYVKTIESKEEELRTCYNREETLKQEMEHMEMKTTSAIESNLREMQELSRSQQLESEQNLEVKYVQLKERHKAEMNKLQEENEKATKGLMEDMKNMQTQAKENLSNMMRQMNDQQQTLQREMERMKAEHDSTITAMEKQHSSTQKQLEDDLEHITKRYKDITETLANVQFAAKQQKTEIQDLNDAIVKKDKFVNEAQGKLTDLTDKLTETKQDLDICTSKLNEADIKVLEQDAELRKRAEQLFELETDFKKCSDELESTTSEYRNLQASFESAQHEINELSATLYDTNKSKAEMEIAKVEAERRMVKLEDDLKELEAELTQKMNQALADQEQRMLEESEQKLIETVSTIHSDYKAQLEEKDAEMVNTVAKHKTEIEGWTLRLNKEKDNFMEMKAFMQDQLDKMEEAKNVVKEKLEAAMKTIQEKVNEIQVQTRTINGHVQTIKGLETDKADLFQKMVKIDDQIRGELNDQFRKEKMESEEKWEIFHATEMQKLKDQMTHEHHMELMAAIEKTETEYKEQISVMANDNALRMEDATRVQTTLEDRIMGYEINIKMLTKGVADLKEDQARKLAELKEQHQKFLEKERKNFEYEINAKETQLKVASTIALGNLEKKHVAALEEVEALHKKAMDDLRNTNTKNALAAKKDAETKLLNETARLKGVHADEMKAQAEKNSEELANTILQMNMQRIAELKEQAELHQQEIDKLNYKIATLNEEIVRRIGVEGDFSRKVFQLESDIVKLKDQITMKSAEIVKLRDRHIIALDTQMENLLREHDAKVFNLNEEHIIEANKMIKDFEQAQDFLRKQIANQQKLLEEAALKYINRESREDDVKKIAELEEDIKRRKRKAHTLMEELEYCKLELSNREANFNKIFNKHPLVGVMQSVGTFGNNNRKSTAGVGFQNRKSESKLPPLPLYSPSMTPLPPALQTVGLSRSSPTHNQSAPAIN